MKKSSRVILVLLFLFSLSACAEEPESDFDRLQAYCEPYLTEFQEDYNYQSQLEDAERVLFAGNYEPFDGTLLLSIMGSAKLIDRMVNDDCISKFDFSEEYEWKIDDYIYYGGSCELLLRYTNKDYLPYCEEEYNTRAPLLPIYFEDGTRLDYEKHFREFKEDGDLGRYRLYLQLRSLDSQLEDDLKEAEPTTTTTSTSTTTTTKPTTTTTKPTTTTTKPTTTTTTSTTTTTIPKIRPELPTIINFSVNRGGFGYIWSVTVEFSEPYNSRYRSDKDFGSLYFKICKDPLGDNYLEFGCKSEDEAWVRPESSLNKELLDDFTIRYSGYLYQRNVTNGYGSDTKWSTSFSQSSLIDKGGNSYWLVPVSLDIFLPHYGSDNCTASFKFMSGWGVPAKSIKYTSFRDRCPKIPNDKTISWDPFSSWNGDTFNGLPAVKIFP